MAVAASILTTRCSLRSNYAIFLSFVVAGALSSLSLGFLFSMEATTTLSPLIQQPQPSSPWGALYESVVALTLTLEPPEITSQSQSRDNVDNNYSNSNNDQDTSRPETFLGPKGSLNGEAQASNRILTEAQTHFETETHSTPRWPSPSFDATRSTEENYKLKIDDVEGKNKEQHDYVLSQSRFPSIRQGLDYGYHSVYSLERQKFQDELVHNLLVQQAKKSSCSTKLATHMLNSKSSAPWIVFTAGVMGAGKTYTLEWLRRHGRLPLHDFVRVDPDDIRRQLPEFDVYCQKGAALQAGEWTRKEAGLLTELLSTAALQGRQSVVVDGTLRDANWYQDYFQSLRKAHPGLRMAILHITAPPEAVLERARNRAKITGRVVPEELLRDVMQQVPESVEVLREQVDVFVELYNGSKDEEIELVTPENMTWEEFATVWECLER